MQRSERNLMNARNLGVVFGRTRLPLSFLLLVLELMPSQRL